MRCEICGNENVELIPDGQGISITFAEKTGEKVNQDSYALYRCPRCGAECKKTEKWEHSRKYAFLGMGEKING